ncbi:orotate phosphoribosyltransferase [Leuconostocaceae bacterium ESL0958]|nr:orotate phosphoribosyltransferase [Leuconostocaceae bacterium ESL0958]
MQKAALIRSLMAEDILQFNQQTLFTFASGIKSPIYTDLRRTIAYPVTRAAITAALVTNIKQAYPGVTAIAGVATAGIPQAALVADTLALPLLYVRPTPKDHGRKKQIEGNLRADDQIVLIDDLISTGGSVLKAAQAIQAAGGHVLGISAIFSYEFQEGKENFELAKLPVNAVITYADLLQELSRQGQLSTAELALVQTFQQQPRTWQQQAQA